MTRSTISLDERGYVLAKDQAHALGSFVAEFVRRAIDTSALIASPTAPKAITPSSQIVLSTAAAGDIGIG